MSVKAITASRARMLAKQERRREPIQALVTEATRERVEQIARKENVSMSEIGRRAIEKFVEAEES